MDGKPPVVMDIGTGYSKIGYSGNVEPNYVFPTVIATRPAAASGGPGLEDLDYFVGDDAVTSGQKYTLSYPVKHGQVDNWDHMEKFWHQCIYRYLRCNPEEHYFILTEPPHNNPENREAAAEIMFETFNAPGLYIGVQAVLALYASYAAAAKNQRVHGRSLTGTVIDSGDGVTHVIPVVEGYVVSSNVKTVPLAGKDITAFVEQRMRSRKEPIPDELVTGVARRAKEQHCYAALDYETESAKWSCDASKLWKEYMEVDPRTQKLLKCKVKEERYLAPEILFTPQLYNSQWSTPLSQVVDNVVQLCPIDTRRALYSNIVLSGGTTMFNNFGKRMENDVSKLVQGRTAHTAQPIQVNVVTHSQQRFAVWFGGSVLGMSPGFQAVCHTREQYLEYGPSICRANAVFADL